MTKDEFLDTYKNVEVSFTEYYKYTFTFRGISENGDTIECSCGGTSEEIYRFEVISGKRIPISDLKLDLYKGIVFRDGKEIDDFYEW